tara:strand:+ start:6978 stop:7193 length:216 start_codon:yes stop_codon:yes gene_type:complete
MANPASPAGNNGVSGSTSGISGGNTAIRKSVAKTAKGYGSAVSASAVYSETPGLRFAYSGVECDSPAIDRS